MIYDVNMTTIQQVTTAQQLLEMPDIGRCELVHGEIIMMSPGGFEHGRIISGLDARLWKFVRQNRLGVVTTADTGFQITHQPDTVRAPDIAFVRAERVPTASVRGFFQGARDLAVEVVSPGDRASEVTAKSQAWLAAGCSEVWVVDPQTATVTIYRSRSEVAILRSSDILDCRDLLPGFRLPVAEIFAA